MKIRKQYITPKFRPIVLASAATLLAGSPSVEGGGSGPEESDINGGDAKSFSGFYDFEDEE